MTPFSDNDSHSKQVYLSSVKNANGENCESCEMSVNCANSVHSPQSVHSQAAPKSKVVPVQ